MEATEILRREHDQILRVLHVAALAADRLRGGEDLPTRQDLTDILEFLREFADGTHHAKEEQCLFPWMVRQGFPQGQGPLACMNMEHEIGRKLIRDIASAIDRLPASAVVLASALTRYIEVLEEHIHKENRVLFVMAERLGNGDTELLPAYEKAVPEPEKVEARFQQILERLERRMGIPPVASQEVG